MRRWGVLLAVVGSAGCLDAQQPPAPPAAQPAAAEARAPTMAREKALAFMASLAAAQSRLEAHLDGLATTVGGTEADALEGEAWESAVYGGKDDYYAWFEKVPEFEPLVAFATRPLSVEGRPIEEKVKSDANRRFGKAQCEGNAPVLLYGYDRHKVISPMAYTFFREHELAHFVLKHSTCPPSGPAPNGARMIAAELEADCWAAHSLSAEGAWGTMVIGVAIDRLSQLDQREDGTHPSSKARVQNLMRCKSPGRVQ